MDRHVFSFGRPPRLFRKAFWTIWSSNGISPRRGTAPRMAKPNHVKGDLSNAQFLRLCQRLCCRVAMCKGWFVLVVSVPCSRWVEGWRMICSAYSCLATDARHGLPLALPWLQHGHSASGAAVVFLENDSRVCIKAYGDRQSTRGVSLSAHVRTFRTSQDSFLVECRNDLQGSNFHLRRSRMPCEVLSAEMPENPSVL